MRESFGEGISLKDICIQDEFWDRYIKLVKSVIIPYQWEILNDRVADAEPSYCIQNFKIAAGDMEGEFKGAVFQDTDVAKWLEAVGFALSSEGRDEKLEELADATIDLIGRAQCKDGYLNTYFTIKEPKRRWSNLKEGHELYTAGHMIEAAVSYYNATGKKQFLEIVSRMADVICDKFGPEDGKCHGYPGHSEIELALVKLYQATGEKKYLDCAKYFIDVRGVGENYFELEEKGEKYKQIFPEFAGYVPEYSQSHLPVREQKTAEGHAVRAVYLYSAMADIAKECKDESLKEACEVLWNNMVNKRMFITGGIGSSGFLERFTTDYDLPNDRNYAESCASIGLAMFGKRMAELTRDAKYIDVVEKALYNTVLAGIAMDGKSFFYVNPLEVWPQNCIERTSMEHVKPIRQKWFGVACCPPNIARTLASLGQYIYGKENNRIYVNLYISNEMTCNLGDSRYRIKMKSGFTKDGKVSISFVREQGSQSAEVGLRIPEYVKQYEVTRNGNKVESKNLEKGYLLLTNIDETDEIEIHFEIKARFVHANPEVRADAGRLALARGPLVYCVEEVDNGKNLASYFIKDGDTITESYEEDVLGGTTVLKMNAKKLSKKEWKQDELYKECKTILEDTEIRAVPYCYWGNRGAGEMIVWLKELLK